MALTKIGSGGIENVTNAANATFLTIDASEQITVASEGGAVTTSLQQGLAKAWERHNASHSIDSSLSVSSITDNGTGDTTVTYASALSTATQAISGSSGNNASNDCILGNAAVQAHTTTTHRYVIMNAGGVIYDRAFNSTLIHGDLA